MLRRMQKLMQLRELYVSQLSRLSDSLAEYVCGKQQASCIVRIVSHCVCAWFCDCSHRGKPRVRMPRRVSLCKIFHFASP